MHHTDIEEICHTNSSWNLGQKMKTSVPTINVTPQSKKCKNIVQSLHGYP